MTHFKYLRKLYAKGSVFDKFNFWLKTKGRRKNETFINNRDIDYDMEKRNITRKKPQQYSEKCPKCPRTIKATSKSQLEFNMKSHLEMHKREEERK